MRRKKGMDGRWFNAPSSTVLSSSSSNSLPYTLAAVAGSLLVIYGVVWVASKAWSKGES